MVATASSVEPRRLSLVLAGPRLLFALGVSALFGVANSLGAGPPTLPVALGHAVVLGLVVTLVFGLLERYPKRPPTWRSRSELERNALDARLKLLQAQVEPHFLFNTLANVQALVDVGSPQAPKVLASLIAYLRAAVPRMHELSTTLGQELELVRAYLELMKMRMPDRLEFTLHVDAAASAQECPPMTLLTLVENAVRHGIDPSEEGGRIDVEVRSTADRCVIRVTDTGLGLKSSGGGLGTGLTTLRERLQLKFGGAARLELRAVGPRGVCAEIDMPARRALP